MFVGLDSSGYVSKQLGVKSFLLNKYSQNFPENIKVFMYFTSSIKLRNALSFTNMDGYFRTHGEISFQPFGFHISIQSPPINRPYLGITNFRNYRYDELAEIKLPLRFLVPEGNFAGIYK
ncbi:hypothetical protein ACNKXS_14315 [Christiangramia marina]|uniref:hypothetical protein n=1 Tax=Christiangramia marina TaxID=409436 RepID=UPI003AA977E8